MTLQPTPLSIPDCAPAMLTLPDPLTVDSISRLEAAIASLLRTIRKDQCGSATDDPGAIEYASWSVHLH